MARRTACPTALEVSGNGDRWRSQQGWQEWGSCQVGGPGNVWNRGHAGESKVLRTKTDEGAGIPVLGFLGVKSKVDPWPTDRQSLVFLALSGISFSVFPFTLVCFG